MEAAVTPKKNICTAPSKPRKRLFVGLMWLSLASAGLFLYGAWKISYMGLSSANENLPIIVGAAFMVAGTFSVLALTNLTLTLKKWPAFPFSEKYIYRLINVLFPMSVKLGKLGGVTRRQIEGSFIAVSNFLFAERGVKVPANRLLVITPHCLQLASCPHKITRDPNNCKRCGGCNIGDLMKLSDQLGFHFLVATGGTLARQMVKETKPKAVLAIACERDLMSGIQDVYPLPAVGILNIRPNGPCYNTKVDMTEVADMIKKIIV